MSGPTHRAYTVIKREGKEDYWLNLGVCFAHNGEGFNVLLQALPTDAKLVLRTYKEKPEEQEKVIKAKFKKYDRPRRRPQLGEPSVSCWRLFYCCISSFRGSEKSVHKVRTRSFVARVVH